MGCLALLGLARASAQPVDQSPVGPPLGIEETEALVRRVDYEGLPESEAMRIGPAGGARLIEMLRDPAEAPHHARILAALGIWGGEGAYDAITNWSAALRSTAADGASPAELDRDAFRAWQVLPFALGRLSRRDSRGLARLADRVEAAPPPLRFRQLDAARMQALERELAVSALAESDLPDAARLLDALARRPLAPALADHLRAVRAERAARGAER